MFLKIIKRALFAAVLLILLCVSWFSYEFSSTPKRSSTEAIFEVKGGETAKDIAKNLEDQGLIRAKWAFVLGYRLFYSGQSLKAGEYTFKLPISAKNILFILTEGKVKLYPVTIPEGLTRRETAQHLESLLSIDSEEFLKVSDDKKLISDLDPEANNLEGYLFPETYSFPKGLDANAVGTTMIVQFRKVFNERWIKRAKEIGMTIREVVILASLIEKETSRPEERSLISGVFHNRLRIGMKLDCDPTIIYVLKEEGRFKDRLRTKDLKFDTPYNTYLHGGLPPGPIANPGKGSLEAALYPAEVDYLYFVSKNDGSHHFSRSFREHQNAVNKYQRIRKNRKPK
jgi:UPF0755 protein